MGKRCIRLEVDDKENDERRLRAAVSVCTLEQKLHHKGIGFQNEEVHGVIGEMSGAVGDDVGVPFVGWV